MEQQIKTHILCSSGGRNLVASPGTAELWGRIYSSTMGSKPNFHAVGAYMAIRGLLSKPNDFDTHTHLENQRIKVKTERGYEISYTLLPDGDIYLNDIQIDFEDESLTQGDKKATLFKVSSDSKTSVNDKPIWEVVKIEPNQLKITPTSVTHILICDSNVADTKLSARYGAPVINAGHPGREVGAGDTFYMFHYPKKRGIKGFFATRKTETVNKKAKFINEIASIVTGAARISASEYQRRQVTGKEAVKKLTNNQKAKDQLGNPNFGNIATKSRDDIIKEKNKSKADKAKALKFTAAKKTGLPDPVVCWTTNGNGDKVFRDVVKSVAKKVNVENVYKAKDESSSGDAFNSQKLQQVFLNNYTVNDNRLDRAMTSIGMEWSEKRGTRSPVSFKNLITDSLYSSEYALLKRRTQVSACEQERSQLHPAFAATSKTAISNALKPKAPLLSTQGAIGAGIKAGATAGAGVFSALVKANGSGELDALSKNMDAIAEKSATALHGTMGTMYKTMKVVTEATASNASTALTVAGVAVVGFAVAKSINSGSLQKAKLLFGQMHKGDLSSMPTNSLGDLETALAFRANLNS
ncbi:hypothetical protein ACG1BZ_10535 [Microbulbifer sp. CNSA002]|uniref:hypothetical protein n=1 Tax=Microbulbifer sp. CNSA002 TaxID=3373604 RepID=UPI0039B6CCDF